MDLSKQHPPQSQMSHRTWATHVKYNTSVGYANKEYIDSIDAIDDRTVLIKAKLDHNGNAKNPLLVSAYVSTYYVIQKEWTKKLENRTGDNVTSFFSDRGEDVAWSGPYHKYFVDESKAVFIRNDNYWGKDPSMWGKLPAPKYLAYTIFKDNAAGAVAFSKGEVDVSQTFIPNIEMLWLKNKLPISTYLQDLPYLICTQMPTAFYNLNSYCLDKLSIRKAIAIAVDYSAIISNAMTNQSPSFDEVPRSLMNTTPEEQDLYDHDTVKDMQWKGNDIDGAERLLDEAGIVDSDGDGWREYNGKKLSYTISCAGGWSDWQAAAEIVASAGKKIGIEIKTSYPEASIYIKNITKSDIPLPEGYDIFIAWSYGSGPAQPWSRIRNLLSSEWIGMPSNYNGNWGRYSNPRVDNLIQAIPVETDPVKLREMYTELVKIYLTDIPSFTLMYRPEMFYSVNESVWTNFPHQGDETNPPVPPLNCTMGWGVAALYNLKLVKEKEY